MGNMMGMSYVFDFLVDPFLPLKIKLIYFGIPMLLLILVITFLAMRKSENFIGTDMWFGYTLQDANKTSKKDRTKSLMKISKGWLPGKRPKPNLIEEFENVQSYYNPRNYEIKPDYHRTVQQFSVDPNPVESLETPEFMIPKTYRNDDVYEALTEVGDNEHQTIKLRAVESTFKNLEKNKYYADLLRSKCRADRKSVV